MKFNFNRAIENAKKDIFAPLDLNEGNVQAIFNRCLAKEDTPKEKETTGVVPEISLINPVLAKDRSTVISGKVTPTLSPKDPAFPAWWEAHKGEWEA